MFKEIIKPRFGDIDGLRHINNVVVPAWFEAGRNPLFELFLGDDVADYEKWNLIMVRMEIDYVGQMRFGADVEIRTFIERIGKSSFTVYQEAWQNGLLGAKGRTICVYFDFKGQKPIPLTKDLIQKLQNHLIGE